MGKDIRFGPPRPVKPRDNPLVTNPWSLTTYAEPAERGPSTPQVDVSEILRILLKWKWLIGGAVLLGVVAAVVTTLMSPRVYRATAQLSLNTTPMEIMGEQRNIQPRVRSEDSFLQTQYGLLKSRSLAARVEKVLKLGGDAGFVAPGIPPAKRSLAATFKLQHNLQVDPLRGSNLVMLDYTDADADRAARIVNAFGTEFIAAADERRYNATAFARGFLQTRLDATRQRLEASERQLVNYAQHQGILQLDRGTSDSGGQNGGGHDDGPTAGSGDSLTSQSLVALNGALANATAERIAAEQRYRQAEENRGATGDVLQSPTVQALHAERARLEADYRERLSIYQPNFPDMVATRNRIAQIDADLSREAGDVSSSLKSAYQAAAGRETELRGQVAGLRANVLDLRNRGIGYTILQREVDTNRTLYDALLQRFKEIGVVGGLGESQADVVDSALPPNTPFEPRPFRNVLIGLLAGLVIGLAAAFGIEFMDDTITSAEDAVRKLKLPVLGVIPRLGKRCTMISELAKPRSGVAEAYHSVTTSLQFTTTDGYPRSILVTSSRPGEGKSSTSLALAQNLARMGASVLLIDADMRKPSFHAQAGEGMGLSKLLITNDPVGSHVVETKTPGLSLLPSGVVPPNPAELLSTSRIRGIMNEAMMHYDVVLVDAPPILGLADAPILGSICEATVMIIEAGSVRRAVVLNALSRLFAAEVRIAGAVLTKFNPKNAVYGYGYGYGYEYGTGEAKVPMLDISA